MESVLVGWPFFVHLFQDGELLLDTIERLLDFVDLLCFFVFLELYDLLFDLIKGLLYLLGRAFRRHGSVIASDRQPAANLIRFGLYNWFAHRGEVEWAYIQLL